jgi:hypothetical protein
METIQLIFGVSFGFLFYWMFSSPSNPQYNKLPRFKYKNIQLSPNFKIFWKNHSIHIHHWISMVLVFGVLTHISTDLSRFLLIKSFCIGGAIQGITYQDRFKILNRIKN